MSSNTVRYALFRQLARDGLTEIFGNPGTSEQSILDLLREPEFAHFKYYLGLNEGAVVAMADAFARYRQKPALVQLHSYPGLGNGLGMLYYAKKGYTPMIILAGEAGLRYEALDAQMSADLLAFSQPFVKSDAHGPCAWRIVDGQSALRLLRRAIKTAFTPPYGPTLLILPMDVLEQVSREPIIPTSFIDARVTPHPDVIAQAVELLLGARRPLFLIGDGVAATHAQAELTALAELCGATVYGANDSELNMAWTHPLYRDSIGHMFGASSRKLLSGADVVLIAGTMAQPEVFPSLDGNFAADAKVIQFDHNTLEIAKNFPVAVSAIGDLKMTFGALLDRLQPRVPPEFKSTAQARIEASGKMKRAEGQQALEADATHANEVPLRLSAFVKPLAERLRKDGVPTVIFDEALTSSPELTRYLVPEIPDTYFQTRVGMLGTGVPGTVGLKAAAPDRRVIGFIGDGGAISTIQALNTAYRHELGAKFVICNNRSYRILKYNIQEYWVDWLGQSPTQPFPESFDLETCDLDFVGLAQAQGVKALRVERPQQVSAAIVAMLANPDEPFLVELILSKDL
jgi:benzoylformate decarboxylase